MTSRGPTLTLSKTISVVSMPLTPIFLSTRGRVTPGESASTMKPQIFAWWRSEGSPTLAKTTNQSACIPPEIQHFVPFRIKPSSMSGSSRARACACRRRPSRRRARRGRRRRAVVPFAMPGKYFCFCSSFPAIMIGPVGKRVKSSISPKTLEYFVTSSIAIVRPMMPAPEPPYSSGMHRPSRSAFLNSSKMSWGYSPVVVDLARSWLDLGLRRAGEHSIEVRASRSIVQSPYPAS